MSAATKPARWAERALALVALAALAGAACAADVKLASAWMRPAPAGSDANVYVDISSDVPLTLLGATSPAARKVELVLVKKYDGTDPGKVVKRMAVDAGTPMRLAYRGSHLRLIGVRTDLLMGAPVPVTLQFRDRAGKRVTAEAAVAVRGLAMPMPETPDPAARSGGG